jgi:decaprenylphospho-beta-D-erythro-pentofuranosid-2-ulose 2-reductase
MRHILIVGATSAIAEQCARIWVKDASAELTLVGRDHVKIEGLRADLLVRSPLSRITTRILDFQNPIAIAELAKRVTADLELDIVLIAHGELPSQDACEEDLGLVASTLSVNGISPSLFAEAFAEQFAIVNHGTIAIIGSVASDRGRRSNYVYGAAKALLAHYAAGLQHRFAGTDVKIVLIKPGPTATPMTADLQQKGQRLARVDRVAAAIVKAIEAGTPVLYTPSLWRPIMFVIRHLPQGIFNKLQV